MRFVAFTFGLALAMASTMAVAQSAPAANVPAAATAGAAYSTTATDVGTLLDDPAAKAVLLKYVPGMAGSSQIDMARGLSLKDLQQYAPDAMSDKVLAEIDAEFAKLPPKK